MSYTRNYRETITVSGSKTVSVSYPASQSSGTVSATVHYTEEVPVNVNINVDTNPFDKSVSHVNGYVDLLTGAIVATETAEIESKLRNSVKVGETIVNGFFSYIRSEISQQITELSQNIDAHLMHLKELAKSCVDKKKQMEGDFFRISGRYVKIFDDLNNELSNRIYELDKPAFVFKKETDNQKIRTSSNDLVNIVTICGIESSDLQSKISTSIAKKRALDTINKSKVFLWQQKKLNSTTQQSMLNVSKSSSIFAPCCYVESIKANNQIDKNIYSTYFLTILKDKSKKNEIIEQFSSNSIVWSILSKDVLKNISQYFNTELNNDSSLNDQHAVRVREMIQKIANISSIKAIRI
ncbi:MAG: hypothetical protein WCL51_10980 [Bacteroidota bacterium]